MSADDLPLAQRIEEPVLAVDEIQGNVVPGFLKPWLHIICLKVSDPVACRRWLARLASEVTTCAQAMQTRSRIRSHRATNREAALAHSVPDGVDDVWLNAALSFAALKTLFYDDPLRLRQLDEFEDPAFTLGLAARSPALGDPVAGPYSPSAWVVGKPGAELDIALIIGADREQRLRQAATRLLEAAQAAGCDKLYEETGHKLDDGREHFGFRDGISQPGVRGRLTDTPDSYLTPRLVAADERPEHELYGLPGQALIWPGEFIFGEPLSSADPAIAGQRTRPGPDWSTNGSYLVFRRLSQNVNGFHDFVKAQAAMLAARPEFHDWTPNRLAAAIVGRWPSGAPLARTPNQDLPHLGADRLANNNFLFAAPAPPLQLTRRHDAYPPAPADPIGLVCPLGAHIRKVNTRQSPNDRGSNRATYQRRILRRGLPYGARDADDRGLLFLSYQTSISEQFEFLVSSWMNDPANPRSPGGHDLLVGQNGQPNQNRQRSAVLLAPSGETATLLAEQQFVNPTGGGYLFSPSISALRHVIGVA